LTKRKTEHVSRDTGFPDCDLFVFSQFLQTYTKTVPKRASDHFPPSHFQFILHHLLVHFHKQRELIFLL